MNTDHVEDVISEEISQEEQERIKDRVIDGEVKIQFYEKLRRAIQSTITHYGGKHGSSAAEYLLALPDFFILLIRLAIDPRVSKGQKIFLGGIIAYVMSPIDIIPDFIPMLGYVDDLVLVVYGLNLILNELDATVLLDNWSGNRDVLGLMQNITENAERFIDTKVLKRIRQWIKNLKQ